MRKCKYSVYITAVYKQGLPQLEKVEGTGEWSEEKNGVFHGWGSSVEYGHPENSVASFSVALVETEEGKIVEVLPSKITFLHTMQSHYVSDTVMLGGRNFEVKDSGMEVWEEEKSKTNYTLAKKLKDWVSMDVKILQKLATIVLKDKALEFDAATLTTIADNILEYVFYQAVDKSAYNPASIAILEGLKPTDILKIKIFLEHNGYNTSGMKIEINGFNISNNQIQKT